MTKLVITEYIKTQYKKSLKKSLLTPKKKVFTARSKRFFTFLKTDLGICTNREIYNLLMSDNIHKYIREYSEHHTDEKNYEIYNDVRKVWAKELVKYTTSVCPYCNRNYIANFSDYGTTVELDHFFPKTKYPYLAINIYNLIPSCHTCNHQKNEKKLKIYPYKDSLNNYILFTYTVHKLPLKIDNIKLNLKIINNTRKNRKKVNNYNNILHISDLYQNHKDTVLELIQKREIYPDSYIDELYRNYSFFNNREDILRLITGGYVDDKDLGKRPLSKLIKDISKELELI